jgi:hypothetical protein
MLAAHRGGGRTSMISFAKAWDRFALGTGKSRPRRATPRELRVLIAHLEASLLEDEAPRTDLGAAIDSHRRLVESRGERRQDYGRALRLLEATQRVVVERSDAAPAGRERQPA